MAWTKHTVYIGFSAGLIAIGASYWRIPYSQLNLPDALLGPSLFVVVAAAAMSRAIGSASFRKSVAIVGAAIPVAVMLRVVVDGAIDPTTHNLWPFELVIASLLGGACSAAGALMGLLVAKLSRSAQRT
jgi:hypothetical protein